MTRTTNARIAGFTFLFYIAAGLTSLAVFRRATRGEGIAAKLAAIGAHPTDVGYLVLLGFCQCFSALVLGVTLYAITREEDRDLAMLGMTCRVGEGIIGGLTIPAMPALLALASTGPGASAEAANVLARYLLRDDVALPATFFAVGSMLFAYLFLRGRMIPMWLAWLGVGASILLVVILPLRMAAFAGAPLTTVAWLPMLVFELVLAVWLLTKGVTPPIHSTRIA